MIPVSDFDHPQKPSTKMTPTISLAVGGCPWPRRSRRDAAEAVAGDVASLPGPVWATERAAAAETHLEGGNRNMAGQP